MSSGVPSMPKNVKVVEYNKNSAHISWDHSDDHVILYAVGYINVDLRSNEIYAARDVSASAKKYVVQGLKPNTRYMFFVRGINGVGHGVPSLLSDVIRTSSATPTCKIWDYTVFCIEHSHINYSIFRLKLIFVTAVYLFTLTYKHQPHQLYCKISKCLTNPM